MVVVERRLWEVKVELRLNPAAISEDSNGSLKISETFFRMLISGQGSKKLSSQAPHGSVGSS